MKTKKKHNSPDVIFSYKLTGQGWAEAILKIGKSKIKIDISYLCNPITDLLSGLDGISKVVFKNKDCIEEPLRSRSYVSWLGESLSHEIRLQYIYDDYLDIVIRSFDADEKRPKKIIVFAETCSFKSFLKAVFDSITALLQKHGIIGYSDTWTGRNDFPLVDYIKLKHFLETGKLYKSRIVKLSGYKNACDAVQCSSLDKDLSYLIRKK